MNEENITIRPKFLNEYIGQTKLKNNIEVFIKAAKIRDEVLEHILFYGPPGLGKTTLAYIIANEMESNIKVIQAPSIERIGDLVSVLSMLKEGEILFIDEIHRLPKFIEEVLYSAMEDYRLELMVGETKKNIKIELSPFTLIGATTKIASISSPLRDRFGLIEKLEYYSNVELKSIVKRTSLVLNQSITDDASYEIAKRSRMTPRICNRLFKRVRDYAIVDKITEINMKFTKDVFNKIDVDEYGLLETDYNLLNIIKKEFNGGPVGINSIATIIGEEKETVEEVYEPFLVSSGFIKRTKRGRVLTDKAIKYLNS